MLSVAMNPEIGMLPPHVLPEEKTFFTPRATTGTPLPEPNAFSRIVVVYKENEVLLSELRSLRVRLDSARAYLRSPACNPVLAEARILHIRMKQNAARAFLRANRIRANEFLNPRRESGFPL